MPSIIGLAFCALLTSAGAFCENITIDEVSFYLEILIIVLIVALISLSGVLVYLWKDPL